MATDDDHEHQDEGQELTSQTSACAVSCRRAGRPRPEDRWPSVSRSGQPRRRSHRGNLGDPVGHDPFGATGSDARRRTPIDTAGLKCALRVRGRTRRPINRDREAERDRNAGGWSSRADRDRAAAGEDEDERSDGLGDQGWTVPSSRCYRDHGRRAAAGCPEGHLDERPEPLATSCSVRRKAASLLLVGALDLGRVVETPVERVRPSPGRRGMSRGPGRRP